jgi:methionine aminotransferase
MIMINTPHNPTATVWTRDDLDRLAALVRGTGIVWWPTRSMSTSSSTAPRTPACAAHPELAARSFVVSSFGKTYHITGWKVGYVLGPRELMAEFRKVHQFNVFTVNTPVQLALADYMADASRHLGLAAFYQAKRDFFRDRDGRLALRTAALARHLLSSSRATTRSRTWATRAFCEHLTRNVGVAAIPVSAFFADGRDERVIRFCFAKNEATLAAACERLLKPEKNCVTWHSHE